MKRYTILTDDEIRFLKKARRNPRLAKQFPMYLWEREYFVKAIVKHNPLIIDYIPDGVFYSKNIKKIINNLIGEKI